MGAGDNKTLPSRLRDHADYIKRVRMYDERADGTVDRSFGSGAAAIAREAAVALEAAEEKRDYAERRLDENCVLTFDFGRRAEAAEARVIALTEELADANQVAEAAMDAHEETCARVAALEDGLQRITSLARQVHPVAGYIFRDDDPAKIARAVLASSVKQEQSEGLGGSEAARSGGGQ